jgi:3-oxoadipate enol-lactonase
VTGGSTRRPRVSSGIAIVFVIALTGCFPLGGPTSIFESEGVEIVFRDVGEGEPILLLHGFGVNGKMQWAQVSGELSGEWRLVIPDHRGHGESEKPASADAYGTLMIEDVIRLLDHLGIERVRVAGMSMGGFMAVKAMAFYPERFRCGFIGAAGWIDPADVDDRFDEEVALAFEQGNGFEMLNSRLNPESEAGGLLGTFFFNLLVGDQDPVVLASVYRGMRELAVERPTLRNLPKSFRLVIGDRDGLLPAAQALAEVSDRAELEVLPGHDHGSIVSAPRFLESMVEFFEDPSLCPPARARS